MRENLRPSGPSKCAPYYICFTLLVFSACTDERSIKLPSKDLSGLGFFVYQDGGKVQATGPVQPAASYSYGTFNIPSEYTGSNLELYLFDDEKAKEVAEQACQKLDSAAARYVCQKTLQNCDRIENCWTIELSDTACDGRLPLAQDDLELTVFKEENDYLIESPSELPETVNELYFCGPKTNLDCPYRIPSFVITKDSFFHCLALSDQASCDLSIDLASCGFESVNGNISSGGELSLVFSDQSNCEITAATNEDTSELGTADFVLNCGGDRYGVTYASTLIGSGQCPHLGPSNFDADIDRSGRLSTLLSLPDQNGSEFQVLTGGGDNNCEYSGFFCSRQASGCVECCSDQCGQNYLERCIKRDDLSTCAESPKASCINECLSCCNAEGIGCDYSRREGLSMVTMEPDRPYVKNSTLKLEPVGRFWEPIEGDKSVSLISQSSAETNLAFIHQRGLVFISIDGSKQLSKSENTIDFSFRANALHQWQNQLIVTGDTDSSTAAPSRAVVVSVKYDDPSNPSASFSTTQIDVPELSQVNHSVTSSKFVFLAAHATANDGSNEIIVLDQELQISRRYTLNGQIDAMTVLNDELLFVSVYDSINKQSLIRVFYPEKPQGDLIRVIRGLRTRSLLAHSAKQRVFMGHEIIYGSESNQTGAVSLIELTASQEYLVRAPFMTTKAGPVNALSLNLSETVLYALSAQGNWISSFELYE